MGIYACDVIVTRLFTRDPLNPTESTRVIFPSVRAEFELTLCFLMLYSPSREATGVDS